MELLVRIVGEYLEDLKLPLAVPVVTNPGRSESPGLATTVLVKPLLQLP